MHRLATVPGGWTPGSEGVVWVEQSPGAIVVLTAADTEIQALSQAVARLPQGFPAVRALNLLQLQQQLTIDTYAESVLAQAEVIVVRLLGGRGYWPYGVEVLRELAGRTGAQLLLLPGDDRPDLELMSHSTLPLSGVSRVWRYWCEGGVENLRQCLLYLGQVCLGVSDSYCEPQAVPLVGTFPWIGLRQFANRQWVGEARAAGLPNPLPNFPKVGVLFYRSHYLADNTRTVVALCEALAARGLFPDPMFVSSLRDPMVQQALLETWGCAQGGGEGWSATLASSYSGTSGHLPKRGWEAHCAGLPSPFPENASGVDVILNMTSFAAPETLWQQLDVPVLQVICSGGTLEQWQAGWQGLSPADMAMNVVLPEVDGRVITRAVSFKAVQTRSAGLDTDVVVYEPVADRIQWVADLAQNWVKLRRKPPQERRIAMILANYPNRDGRLANGVGLDTPASCVAILRALQDQGYGLDRLPQSGQVLIDWLTQGQTNDPEGLGLRPIRQSLSCEAYAQFFASLPGAARQAICDRWGCPYDVDPGPLAPSPVGRGGQGVGDKGQRGIAGVQLGNIFVGIQPPRGYDRDPSFSYHAPDLPPTHDYLAFYHWLRQDFQADAILHVGKHGNLEWLPGKSLALSQACHPEIALGPLPHFYPFIVNDPGEGCQAKRRAHAIILDHLTPPMTRAELYGPLLQLETLIDEYYDAQQLDPQRLPLLRDRILTLLKTTPLTPANCQLPTADFPTALTSLDTYLCELKEAQIRDGLHVFGLCPQATQLRDLIIAIARTPSPGRVGLTRAIAQAWGWDWDPLTVELGKEVGSRNAEVGTDQESVKAERGTRSATYGDAVESIERYAAQLIDHLLAHGDLTDPLPTPNDQPLTPFRLQRSDFTLSQELAWITKTLLPALQQTSQELTNLLHGLQGGYVASGPSGAPTRGRPEVLPTGRNFYAVDIRGVPTESAWAIGQQAAATLVERYTQDHGEYPQTLGLSVWGTATMRTGGDDIAEALALLGVRPVWDGPSRRVTDFEILPLTILGRPRVDVTLRISGFFRDAFPNLIDLFDQAVGVVAALEEPPEQNPLAARVRQETQLWQGQGLSEAEARRRSRYRIFSSPPGTYGTGLQGLIDSQNWQDEADLARAYLNWSSFAYSAQSDAQPAPEALEQRLRQMQIVLHNQDNREHDLLDSDDYYQFQGGLAVAVRSLSGTAPVTYFGDHALPENPKIRTLTEEINRVYHSRVVNPKWIAGVLRHGYKGACEMAATLDFLFAYDATTRCGIDQFYEGITQAYVLAPDVQAFLQTHNPWALRDMAERLLEAHQRGLWKTAPPALVAALRQVALEAEGQVERKIPPDGVA